MPRDAHRGRRSPTFTKAKQEQFLEHLRDGVRRGQAADLIKVPRRVVREHIALHDDFDEKVGDAEQDALENVEEALYQAAISGNVSACKMWLDYKRGRGSLPAGPSELDKALDEMNRLAGS